MWVGYDIDGEIDDDQFIDAEGWSDAKLAEYGVATFKHVTPEELERWKTSQRKPPRSRES